MGDVPRQWPSFHLPFVAVSLRNVGTHPPPAIATAVGYPLTPIGHTLCCRRHMKGAVYEQAAGTRRSIWQTFVPGYIGVRTQMKARSR